MFLNYYYVDTSATLPLSNYVELDRPTFFSSLSRMNIPLLVQGVSVILVQTLYPLFYFNTLRAFVDGQLEQGNVRVQ